MTLNAALRASLLLFEMYKYSNKIVPCMYYIFSQCARSRLLVAAYFTVCLKVQDPTRLFRASTSSPLEIPEKQRWSNYFCHTLKLTQNAPDKMASQRKVLFRRPSIFSGRVPSMHLFHIGFLSHGDFSKHGIFAQNEPTKKHLLVFLGF